MHAIRFQMRPGKKFTPSQHRHPSDGVYICLTKFIKHAYPMLIDSPAANELNWNCRIDFDFIFMILFYACYKHIRCRQFLASNQQAPDTRQLPSTAEPSKFWQNKFQNSKFFSWEEISIRTRGCAAAENVTLEFAALCFFYDVSDCGA